MALLFTFLDNPSRVFLPATKQASDHPVQAHFPIARRGMGLFIFPPTQAVHHRGLCVGKQDEIYEIQFLEWDKFEPDKRVKQNIWHRTNNDIFGHPKLIGRCSTVWAVYFYLCCERSKVCSNTVVVMSNHVHRVINLRHSSLYSCLHLLSQLKIINIINAPNFNMHRCIAPTDSTDRQTVQIRELKDPTSEEKMAENQTSETTATRRKRAPRSPTIPLPTEINAEWLWEIVLAKNAIRDRFKGEDLWLEGEFLKIAVWCEIHRERCVKTARGWTQFVRRWLEKSWDERPQTKKVSETINLESLMGVSEV